MLLDNRKRCSNFRKSILDLLNKWMYIYLMGKPEGPIKIGLSKNPEKRLKQLQTGYPEKLSLFEKFPVPEKSVKKFEKLIHDNLRYKRTHGEWFDLTLEEAKLDVEFFIIRYLN